MVKKKKSALSNTKIAIIFFVFLILVIGISLLFKAIFIIKASKFDDSRRFTLSVTGRRITEVITLYADSKDMTVFKLNEKIDASKVGRILEIPIDGFVDQSSLNLDQEIDSMLTSLIFNYKNLKTNLTIIDFLKLAVYSKIIPGRTINTIEIKDTSEIAINQTFSRLVREPLIEKENQTIQIVNATAISGLGNRLAKLITNMGGNVIIVATDDNQKKKSTISYIDQKTYTVKRLQEVLGYEVIEGAKEAISDITITIGENGLSNLPF